MSFFSTGVSALNAAQMGLTTTGQNISNANTAGYHLESIVQSAAAPVQIGSAFVGQGVHIDTITRAYSSILDSQVNQALTMSTSYSTYQDQVSQIDNIVADPNIGLSPSLQAFFTSISNVAANPQDMPTRQSMVTAGNSLVNSFQTLSQQLAGLQTGVNTQIGASVISINSLAQQIASVNVQVVAQSSGGLSPNSLLDTRNNLISQLNQQVSTTALMQSNGSMSIYMGNGQPLVLGPQAFTLTSVPSAEDPSQMIVAYQSGGSSTAISSSSVTGGMLGGVLSFRQASLDPAQNALGQVAMGLAQSFNNQHKLGQDLNGNAGGDFFVVPTPAILPNANNTGTAVVTATLDSATGPANLTASDYKLTFDATNGYVLTRLSDNTTTIITPPSATVAGLNLTINGSMNAGDSILIEPTRSAASQIALSSSINMTTIAAAAPILGSAATANTGNATITPGVVDSQFLAARLLAPFSTATITFDGAVPQNYSINGGASQVYTANAVISDGSGWSVQISGTPAAGDTFTVQANTGGVGDNRNALLMARLQTTNSMSANAAGTPTTTYQGIYNQLVTQVGSQTAQVKAYSQAQTALLSQAKQQQQSLSGVNLDQEAANLMQYQQAYQAAGKILQMSSTLFTSLLQAI